MAGVVGRFVLLGLVSLAVIAALGVFATSSAFADDVAQEQLQVEKQLGCPICTDLPLNVCTNEICTQMKGIIHQKLSEGETPDQVVQYFVARYGDGVLLTPPQQGFSLAVWYLPFVAVILGGLIVWAFLRQSMRRQEIIDQRLATADPTLEAYRERIREEMDSVVNKLEETG